MSDRYTCKDAERAFAQLLTLTGHRSATAYNDMGGWTLDYVDEYGGYVVEEISTPGGGVNHPLGSRRRSAREFTQAVHFATMVISARKEVDA